MVNGTLPASVKAMWLNVIHLSADWKFPFDKDDSHKGRFYNIDGTIKSVQFMAIYRQRFRVMPYEDGLILELPYRGSLSMYICTSKALPKNFDSLKMDEMGLQKVNLFMPKFNLSYEMDLRQILIDQGIEAPFRTGSALPGLTGQNMMIDAMKQKSKIDVDESGTRASAVTYMTATPISLDSSPTTLIILNHPFFFVVRDTLSNINLFAGKVNKF